MAEECDLDSLTALLDDSDMEDEGNENKMEDSQSKVENKDDECDIDEITAFLEQSDSEEEPDMETDQVKGEEEADLETDQVKENSEIHVKKDEDCDENESSEDEGKQTGEVDTIKAELLEMQRKMLELQERLASSQSTPKHKKPTTQSTTPKHKKPTTQSTTPKHKKPTKSSNDKSHKTELNKKDVKNEKHQSTDLKSSDKAVNSKNTVDNTSKENNKPAKEISSALIAKKLEDNKLKSEKYESASISKPCQESKGSKDHTKLKTKSPSIQRKTTSDNQNSNGTSKRAGLPLQDEDENPFFPAYESKVKTEKSATECEDVKTLEQSLFGDDNDSDWEPMGDDDKVKLSDEGHELSKIIKDSGKVRQSNVTPGQVEEMRKKAQKSNWKAKSSVSSQEMSSVNKKSTKENEAPCSTDPFSGIRIVNPKISSLEMKSRMRDRKLVKISKIDRRVCEHDNWVTIGVITHKTDPRQSSTGKTYCIWKLSDLQDCDKVISFFLFGEVYKQHWKNEVTSVVGILNPNLMDKAEKVQNDLALTVSHPGQVMMMGYSKDFGRCAAVIGKGNLNGKHCTNFINKQQGEFCTFHVQRAYSKTCSQRTELQGSYSGMTPSNHKYKPKDKKDSYFFYQGQTYTTGKMPGQKENKKKITVDKLKQQQAKVGNGKVTTMSLHSIDPEDIKRLEKLDEAKKEQNPLLDMLSVPSVGSMNFVKHLMVKDQKPTVNEEPGKTIIQSVTAADLLKQHKQEMRQRRQAKSGVGITPPPADPLKCMPTLGRGLSPGGDICLEMVSRPRNLKSDLLKQKAIAKIQSKGGIDKGDPNAVKRKISPKAQSKIKKRIHESHEVEDRDNIQEPPRKRSKLLGNIDENSEEFKLLMKARSKHTGALAEVEAETEEKYFMAQEKKERLEDKMAATMEVKAIVFTCKQCNYTAHKPKDECKQQNHDIVKVETMKRFFKCKKCGNRTTSIDKLPKEPCKNCGEDNYERVSMLQERKGPKLAHENLCIRGDEIKYLGAMNEKVYL